MQNMVYAVELIEEVGMKVAVGVRDDAEGWQIGLGARIRSPGSSFGFTTLRYVGRTRLPFVPGASLSLRAAMTGMLKSRVEPWTRRVMRYGL